MRLGLTRLQQIIAQANNMMLGSKTGPRVLGARSATTVVVPRNAMASRVCAPRALAAAPTSALKMDYLWGAPART